MRFAQLRMTLLLAILWMAGCTTADTRIAVTPDPSPATRQPSPTVPPAPTTQPSATLQPPPTVTVQPPTVQLEPAASQPTEEAVSAPQVISFSVAPVSMPVNLFMKCRDSWVLIFLKAPNGQHTVSSFQNVGFAQSVFADNYVQMPTKSKLGIWKDCKISEVKRT